MNWRPLLWNRHGLGSSIAACALVASSACGSGAPKASESGAEETRGRLVIVGGALKSDNAAVYEAILEARDGDGPFCILPTASGVPDEATAWAIEAFQSYGTERLEGIHLTTDNANAAADPLTVERLWACSGFWFTGGVQSRVTEVFLPGGLPTSAYEAVMTRFAEGAVVAGSSAGAAMMPPLVIAGGSSAGALENGVVATEEQGGVIVEQGMGFFDGALLDQHFLARGRIGRLIVATLAGVNGGIGLGIDENTAVVVDGDRARVIGASGAVLVDAREADKIDSGYGGRGVLIRLVGSGDAFDLSTLEVTPAAEKRAVPTSQVGVSVPEDPFARWAFLHVLADLSASDDSRLVMVAGRYLMTVEEGPGFSAVSYGTPGVEGTLFGLSAGPLSVALAPER